MIKRIPFFLLFLWVLPFTATLFAQLVPGRQAPTIEWTAAPSTVESNVYYQVAARGADLDGNLSNVRIWTTHGTVAASGPGDGYSNTASTSTFNLGAQTVLYYAQSTDEVGYTSPIITLSVTITVPPVPTDPRPSIQWTSAPSTVQHRHPYTISARALDAQGDLVSLTLTKAQSFFASGAGSAGELNATQQSIDDGPQVILYQAQAVDATGAQSTLSHWVTIIYSPPSGGGGGGSPSPTAHAPTITWQLAPASAGSATPYTVSAHADDTDGNLANITITKDGLTFISSDGGSGYSRDATATTQDSGPRTVTFTAVARDSTGLFSEEITLTVTIGPPNAAPTIEWLIAPGLVAHQTDYTLSARGRDSDGNLATITILKNGAPFASAGAGNGQQSDATGTSRDTGPQTITYTAQSRDAAGALSPVLTRSITVSAAGAPLNLPPQISWLTTPVVVAHSTSYQITAQAIDPEGTMTNVTIWKNGVQFATAGQAGTTAATAFALDSGPSTVEFTAQATDAAGVASPIIRQTVNVAAPNATTYLLFVNNGPGGNGTTGMGVYPAGAMATATATPSQIYDFAGWTGDVTSPSATVSVLMDRTKTIQANFAIKQYTLTTTATPGGTVTPGGTYSHGTVVYLTATPTATGRWLRWEGDLANSFNPQGLVMDRAKTVNAVFALKDAQSITFTPTTTTVASGSSTYLYATASSGLAVTYAVTSGPGAMNGNQLQVTGTAPVVVQASQAGNAFYLPASPVSRTFNDAPAQASTRYQGETRTLLRHGADLGAQPFVSEKP